MSEQTPGRRGSGAQIFNKILTELGLRLTPPEALPQATERLRAAMLLHGSTAYETVLAVQRLAWGSEADEDGEVARQGVVLAPSGLFVTDLLQDLLDAPGVKAHLQACHPEMGDADYEAFESALWWLVCARDMYTHRLQQEQSAEPIDLDAWVEVIARKFLRPPCEEDVVRDLDVTSLALLDCVSDLVTTLAQLTSPNFDERFNRAPLPLDKAGVLHLIEALHARGLLFIHAGATPIDPAHLADVPDPTHTWVALTNTGAQTWEAHFQPDWNQRVSDDLSFRDDGMALYEFVSPSRQQLEDIRQQIPAHAGGVTLEAVCPLDMNYWKRFPQGYRLSFTLPEGEDWGVPAR